MKLKNSVLLTILTIGIILSFFLFVSKSSFLNSLETVENDTIQAVSYNLMGDKFRESNPDSSLYFYYKTIGLLHNQRNGINEKRMLALSYIGLAYNYSAMGEMEKAIQNDSIALNIAQSINNYQIQAKAKNIRGSIYFRTGKFDMAFASFQEAELLAKRANDLQLQAKIWSNRAQIYFFRGDEQKAVESFTKTLQIALQTKNDPFIAGSYMNLGVFNQNTGNYKNAVANFEKALPIFSRINEKSGILLCYQNIGAVYYLTSQYDKAIEFFRQSAELSLQMKDKSNTSKGYHNLAEAYGRLGDNQRAIDYYFKSIVIKEQLSDKMGIAIDLTSVADFYFQRKEYQKALDYFNKSLTLNLEIKYLKGIASDYSNIANAYSITYKKDSTIKYYTKALSAFTKINDPSSLSLLYINLGLEYGSQKQFSLAEQFLYKGISMKMELSDQEGCAAAYYQLANLYLQKAASVTGNAKNSYFEKAIASGMKSYNMATALKTLPVMKEASLVLKEAYQKKGMLKEALFFADQYSRLNEKLTDIDKIQALTYAEARWNADKKQRQIVKLQSIQSLNQEIIKRKEAEARRQKMFSYLSVALSLLAALLVLVLSLYFRRRSDALFQKQMSNITTLRMQNARNTMSPHFFFNVLGSFSGLSNQQEIFKERLNNLSLLLRKVIENIDKTAIPMDVELSTVKAYIDLQRLNIPEPFRVEYKIAEGVNLGRLIPAMILQIPVENAIKHGLMPLDGEKLLGISIAESEGCQHIIIEDNGIGLKASVGRSTGTGTGLKVLLQTIHLLNTSNRQKIQFSIEERKSLAGISLGTIVTIFVPFDFDFALLSV